MDGLVAALEASELLQKLRHFCGPERAQPWRAVVLLLDAVLTLAIVRKVRFTNIDWEAYMHEVSPCLNGTFNYDELKGPTGPIAYPAGFIYFYAALNLITDGGLNVLPAQLVFVVLELLLTYAVTELYKLGGAPGWLMGFAILSKRVHSIFVLRLFNDAVASTVVYVAFVMYMYGGHVTAALLYSCAVSVKISPILYAPAFGLLYVVHGGWRHALRSCVLPCLLVQLVLGLPFIMDNPQAYLARAFGGPGDLQQVWSVNWKWLSSDMFMDRKFPLALVGLQLVLLLWFAHSRWCPQLQLKAGLVDKKLWIWRRDLESADASSCLMALFSCNLIGVALLRTLHFQYLVWYFHTIPYLVWRLCNSLSSSRGAIVSWLREIVLVALAVLSVEGCYLITRSDTVRGPDGRSWETSGTPTQAGSFILTSTHVCLILSLACSSHIPRSFHKEE